MLLVNSKNVNSKSIYFIFFLILFLIAAYRREGVDNDFPMYYNFYENINIYKGNVELSYTLISSFVYNFFRNFSYVLVIYSFIASLIMYFAIKRISPFPVVSLMIFAGSYFLLQNMTQIRAACAIALMVFSIPYLINKNLFKFILTTALAVFFHYSAAIMLILLFLNNNFITKKQRFLLAIFPILTVLFSYFLNIISLLKLVPIPYVRAKVEGYLYLISSKEGGQDEINVFNSLFIVKLIIYFVLLYKSSFFTKHYDKFPILIKIYSISIISLPAFSVIPALATRYNEFFGIIEIILIPLFLYYIKPYRITITFIVIIPLMISYIYIFHNEFFKIIF